MRSVGSVMLSVLVAASTCRAPAARADVFSDVTARLSPIRALRETARSVAGSAAQGVRDEANKFMDEKIDPLIARIDAILASRIEQAATEANALLDRAQSALTQVIAFAKGQIDDSVDHFFGQLNKTLDDTLKRVNGIVDDALCRLAPEGQGLRINLPLVPKDSCIKVEDPANTECYRLFPGALSHPGSATFCDREFYRGEICETELALGEVDPNAPSSTQIIANYYAEIARLASQALCFAHVKADREYFIAKEVDAEKKADLFLRLFNGESK